MVKQDLVFFWKQVQAWCRTLLFVFNKIFFTANKYLCVSNEQWFTPFISDTLSVIHHCVYQSDTRIPSHPYQQVHHPISMSPHDDFPVTSFVVLYCHLSRVRQQCGSLYCIMSELVFVIVIVRTRHFPPKFAEPIWRQGGTAWWVVLCPDTLSSQCSLYLPPLKIWLRSAIEFDNHDGTSQVVSPCTCPSISTTKHITSK